MHIYALTDKGYQSGKAIQQRWNQPTELFYKPVNFKQQVQSSFRSNTPLVLICATGIAVRVLAAVLGDKYRDPPVLVMDESARFIIPLLSGHQGGANQLAHQLAQLLNAIPVLTTANSYLDPVYALGVGCERHCPLADIEAIVSEALCLSGLSVADISVLASIDIKSDEQGFIAFAEKNALTFTTFSVDALKTVDGLLSQRSSYVYQTVGVYGVAESAALYAAQAITVEPAELVVTKIKNTKATCAIARSYPVNHTKIES